MFFRVVSQTVKGINAAGAGLNLLSGIVGKRVKVTLGLPLLREQRQLRHFIRRSKTTGFYGEASDRPTIGVAMSENIHGGLRL